MHNICICKYIYIYTYVYIYIYIFGPKGIYVAKVNKNVPTYQHKTLCLAVGQTTEKLQYHFQFFDSVLVFFF